MLRGCISTEYRITDEITKVYYGGQRHVTVSKRDKLV